MSVSAAGVQLGCHSDAPLWALGSVSSAKLHVFLLIAASFVGATSDALLLCPSDAVPNRTSMSVSAASEFGH